MPRLLRRLDHDGRVGPLAERPDHLDMVRVADERDEMTAVRVAASLGVHLVHERARRIDDTQPARLRVFLHRRRDTVGREHADLTLGNLRLVLDEDGAELLQPADHVLVVDDLVAHVHRRAVLLQQPLDDLDRTVDARAERARRSEQDSSVHATDLSRVRSAETASFMERIASPRRVATQRRRPTTSVLPSG